MDHLDFYGTSYSLNTLGKSSYKTVLSFISSLVTVVLIGTGAWLIGKDFFFKLNPKVINSTLMPEVSEPVYVNNRNFTFAFRIEADFEVIPTDEELYAFPHFHYYILKRNERGEMTPQFDKIYNPVPCLQTEAKDNPLIHKFNPETLNCFDMEEIKKDLETDLGIKDQDVGVYGGFDENYTAFFYLIFTNCKYKDGKKDLSTCISYDEAIKRSSKRQFMSIYVPKVTFSPEEYEEPLKTYYDNIYYVMSPQTNFVYYMNYSIFTLTDDRGWIFEDVSKTLMVDLAKEEKDFKFLSEGAFDNNQATMFSAEIRFQRKQIKANRVYTKIQELAANLGGIMKLVFFVFTMMNKTYSRFKIETFLVKRYYSAKMAPTSINSSSQAVNTKIKREIDISFFEYLTISFRYGKQLKAKKIALETVRKKFDVETIFKLYESNLSNCRQNTKQIKINELVFESKQKPMIEKK